MKLAIVVTVLALGCSNKTADKTDKTPAKTTDKPCAEYGQHTAELMYLGFERGSHGMAKYIKPEFIAAVAPPLADYCVKQLPAEHVTCVVDAKTATDADHCGATIDADLQRQTSEKLKAVITAAMKVSDLPATEPECAAAATVMVKEMTAGAGGSPATLPTAAQIVELCRRDQWTADFVRCTSAGDHDCKSKPNVREGVTKLVGDLQKPK